MKATGVGSVDTTGTNTAFLCWLVGKPPAARSKAVALTPRKCRRSGESDQVSTRNLVMSANVRTRVCESDYGLMNNS